MGSATTLSVVLAAIVVAGAVVASVAVIVERIGRLRRVSAPTSVRSRRHELHWIAIRYRNYGITGSDLQEVVCREANCSPGEANAAIFRVGADL